MNNRINEIAAQAGMHKWGIADDAKWFATERHAEGVDLEKFAQLLIQECLTFVEPTPGSGDIDDLALESATAQIKEHFGIK